LKSKLLIIGGSGLVGSTLLKYAWGKGNNPKTAVK
jgi:hypothetical protein